MASLHSEQIMVTFQIGVEEVDSPQRTRLAVTKLLSLGIRLLVQPRAAHGFSMSVSSTKPGPGDQLSAEVWNWGRKLPEPALLA